MYKTINKSLAIVRFKQAPPQLSSSKEEQNITYLL